MSTTFLALLILAAVGIGMWLVSHVLLELTSPAFRARSNLTASV